MLVITSELRDKKSGRKMENRESDMSIMGSLPARSQVSQVLEDLHRSPSLPALQ